ncbi:hypothetical protein B0H63DRAFT_514992 [Podospora didyma]|uniref:Uncharacterized protein n=1 Tax=Podospora didyma TaxID=330526 RepID=A0AAE0K2F9_9PEZI|nr:hypothetical protein B0H63DRAFT_514992 [Podospora didyma]
MASSYSGHSDVNLDDASVMESFLASIRDMDVKDAIKAYDSPLGDRIRAMKRLAAGSTKVIVGLDFGTTYSGLSWVLSNRTKVDDVEIVKSWPNSPGTVAKVPTVVAYASENRNDKMHLTEDKFGFCVTGDMKSYSWTKLLLDQDALANTEFDKPSLKHYFGSGLMALPRGKSAQDVCTDYMRFLYDCLIQRLEAKSVKLRITPMEVWLTVPAIWSDKAKQATILAARSAGFASRNYMGDTISVITEPEAAALTVLKPKLDVNVKTMSKNILVCDAGGGTVDITCYTVDSQKGRPVFKELPDCDAGAKCGSTAIDRGFDNWMTKRFGAAYTSLNNNHRGPRSNFMRSFECAKFNFIGLDDDTPFIVYPINMNAPDSDNYDSGMRDVCLTAKDMQRLFGPVVKSVIELIDNQIRVAKNATGQHIEEIFLVGGFGDSKYLNDKIKEWCLPMGIQLTCPTNCQTAVVTGAALRGLFGLKPTSRICRRHYGYSLLMPFRHGIDDVSTMYTSPWDDKLYSIGRLKWVAKKASLDGNTDFINDICWTLDNFDGSESTTNIVFYASDADVAPESNRHREVTRIGRLVSTFTDEEIASFRRKTKKGREMARFMAELKIDLNADTGLLEFHTLVDGREAGYTAFNYEGLGSTSYEGFGKADNP